MRKDGYIDLWRPGHPLARSDGYVMEHRVVLYEAGLTIPDGFEVHHVDEDRANNALDNLAVLTAAAHHRLHHPPGAVVRNQHGDAIIGAGIGAERRAFKASLGERRCPVCGTDITGRRTDAQVCSDACRTRRRLGLAMRDRGFVAAEWLAVVVVAAILIALGFIAYAAIGDEPEHDREAECRARGGSVFLDRHGNYDGCLIREEG